MLSRVGWLSSLVLVSSTAWALDEALPHYEKVSGISGSLLSVGSDTLAGMTTLWVEEFQAYYPAVNAQVQASGSATAPPALSESTAQFGPMSRPMRSSEIAAFEAMHGYKPTALRVAIDAVGIFVHRDNPIKGLNFQQLDAIFSATLRCGATQPILGLSLVCLMIGQSAIFNCLVATRYPVPTAILSKTRCAKGISRTESMSSRARLRWCSRLPLQSIRSVIQGWVIVFLG